MNITRLTTGAAVAGVALAMSGCGGSGDAPPSSSSTSSKSTTTTTAPDSADNLGAAVQECERAKDDFIPEYLVGFLEDRASNISLGTKEGNVASLEAIVCILQKAKAPNYVITHIDSTRALDGQQTEEWGHYKARWTYHPDNGLNITIIDTKATT